MAKDTGDLGETKLVGRLLRGDEGALREFVRIFEPKLLRFVLRKANLKDAEEIVQDTLVAAMEALPVYAGRSNLFSFLCGIARHEIADFYRKRRIKTVVFSQFGILQDWVSELAGPEGKLDERMLRRRVYKTLAKLMPLQRKLIKLKYIEELPVERIAQRLGMSFKAAESALFRARKAFSLAFENYEQK